MGSSPLSPGPAPLRAPLRAPLPAPLPEQGGETFTALVVVMRRLLAPDGCPWDREQDFRSLREYVREEAAEVVDAIESGDLSELKEELGDLLLQVVFLSELGRSAGAFGPDDVVKAIVDKLVRRHPHVFGTAEVSNSGDVVRQWDAIKAEEKRDRRLLDGVPRSLSALERARRLSDRVSQVGFDWPDGRASREKVTEELAELDEAFASGDAVRTEAELGDLLFALVNFARHSGLDAERALRSSSDRFVARFAHVEDEVRARHGGWRRSETGKPAPSASLEELDRYWEAAKSRQR